MTCFLWALAVLIFSSCVTLQAWVALQIGTALGCMGNTLNLVCIEIDLELLQTRVLIALGELKKVSICVNFLWPSLIQIGSVFARMTFHLSIVAGRCVNHWHSCSLCYLMHLVLKLGWCARGNFLEIPISECPRNVFWHAGVTAAWWCHWYCHVKQTHLLPHERIWHEVLK